MSPSWQTFGTHRAGPKNAVRLGCIRQCFRDHPRAIEPPNEEYTARSQQRYMERQIRKYKDRMRAAITPQDERQAYNMVKRWQSNLRRHIEKNSDKVLLRQYMREGGKVSLSDAAKQLKNQDINGIMKLSDIPVPRSLSAKGQEYWVLNLKTGEKYPVAPGTRLRNVTVFAGKGTKTPYRKAYKFAERFGGKEEDWQHVKGYGTLDTGDGYRDAELHWSQCDDVGKKEFFLKRWLDE